jgi:hypothetical protein
VEVSLNLSQLNFTQIDPKYIVLAIVVLVVILLVAAISAGRRSATRARIRERFGPEYDRAVQAHGSERLAEAQLLDRTRRVEKLNLRELAPAERTRFTDQWNSLQARFVDSPQGATAEADDLLVSLMEVRGYPMSDFEQRAADISVDHPVVVENYRSAHAIAQRLHRGEASTEDLRKAMLHYRTLFDEMVHTTPTEGRSEGRRDVA